MEVPVFTGGSGASLEPATLLLLHIWTARLSDLRSDTLCAAFTWLSYIGLIEKTPTVTSRLYWFVHPSSDWCHLAKPIHAPTCSPPETLHVRWLAQRR